ncbi:DnaJ domain-containing protein [Phormidium tenue FACHB-886]|nr:DnaJ domain-containing protein [Phormidium tenue FACHB-886]
MSLKIDQGLFNLDFTDCHAILGAPVDADVKEIRKRYLNIARRLHPDSCATEHEADRQRAAEYLSKLVNPAYEVLSQEKNHPEYSVLLRLKGQQALKQQDTVVLTSDLARQLAATADIDVVYREALQDLIERQYKQLNQVLEVTGQISELNLVYLMRKESRGESVGIQRKPAHTPAGAAPKPAASASRVAPPPTREALIAANLRRSEGFEAKQDYPRAILELREAIKMEPTNSECHSRLGQIYLKTNQNTMAKIHFNKALELNPQDSAALAGKSRLEAIGTQPSSAKAVSSGKPDPKTKPAAKGGKPDNGSGGLFGLFGGKKR